MFQSAFQSTLQSMLHRLIQRPLILLLGLVIIIAAGIQGWYRMPVDLLPQLDVPVVNIITHLPGASPQDVDFLVSRPIASRMRGMASVHRVASTSAQGISQISIQFDWGTPVQDARQLVQARLSQLVAVLPQGVTPHLESIGTTLQEVAGYVITGSSDPVQLTNAVRYQLLPRLTNVDGVSLVNILGGEQRAFIASIKPEALMRLHLRLPDIASALARANKVEVSGFSTQGGREWLVRADGRAVTLHDLGKIVVGTTPLGRPVLLAEIADLRAAWAPKHYIIHGGGKPAIALLVRKQPGASALLVVRQVDQALKHLQQLLPPGTKIQKFYDQSEIITHARDEIVQDLWLGAVLVVGVLYFFLGAIRPTLVVALTIPITLLATLAAMQLLGLSLNVITMTALALAIGMVVDDAIIVAENIARHADTLHAKQGRDHAIAAVEGTVEISGPDASGTFTTIAAFLPLILLGGMASLFLHPFGWTISIALLASLLISLTMVPVLSAHRKFRSEGQRHAAGDRLMERIKATVLCLLQQALPHRKMVSIAVLGFVALAVIAAATGRANLLPPLDEGALLIEYTMPPGTSLAESNRIANRLERIALAQPDVSTVYRRTGSPMRGYQIEGVNRGEMTIKLVPTDQRTASAAEIMNRFKRLYAPFSGISVLYHQPTQEKMDESFSGLPALFGVTVYGGENGDILTRLANRVEAVLKKSPQLSNIINNNKIRSNQITVRLRPGALAQYGLTPMDVMNIVRAAGLGIQTTQIIHGQETIPVLLRLQGVDLKQPDKIAHIPVPLPNGEWIPLSKVADIIPAAVAASITRVNGQREITLLAEADGNILSVARQVGQQLATLKMPSGYSVAVSGQYQVLIHTAIEFLWVAVAAALLIYLIMVLQFGSWLQPLAILAAIPLALSGGLIALRLSGEGVDVSAGMGALTLIGIAVNNGIVLVDFANRRMQEGASSLIAWEQAISVRLRPVLLTAITTMASLLPIAIGWGGASEIFRPFAITVIGGLIAAMFGSLLILPILLINRNSSAHS
ncbi:MAG: efflux RND transporter permease subunit [Mariprofundales bacterium]|nr:efflux RND transporter permease subunit [Mariprofundales bacterium]